MFVEGKQYELEKLHEQFLGQRQHGIITPKRVPYIFLIHTKGEYQEDNLSDDGYLTVNYAYEGNKELSRGNKAIAEHTNIKGVYHSIFLFENLKNSKFIEYIGEYELKKGFEFHKEKAFILEKVEKNIDKIKLYVVEKVLEVLGNEKMAVITEIGKRIEYFEITDNSETKIESVGLNVNEGVFLYFNESEESYDIIELNNAVSRDVIKDLRTRKVLQHLWILQYQAGFIRRSKKDKPRGFIKTNKVSSYHINTGCGNATFIVLENEMDRKKSEIWCFDCGVEEKCTKNKLKNKLPTQIYKKNICDCLEYIRKEHFGNNDFNFNKLFISHPHTDHYNSLLEDIDEKYIQGCELWINPYILSSSTSYLNFLNKIEKLAERVIEPIKSNSIDGIEVLRPEKSLVFGEKIKGARVNLKLPKASSRKRIKKYNNLSPIIKVTINNICLLITGDVEKEGWQEYIEKCESECQKLDIDIFCYSHHGSPTGFFNDCKLNKNTKTIAGCFKSDYGILMTRNGAYDGIIEKEIINNSSSVRLLRTDNIDDGKTIKFLKIDWETKQSCIFYN